MLFLCMDGIYNMDREEAQNAPGLIGAKHNIPIHMKPGGLFDEEMANAFDAPGKLVVRPGEGNNSLMKKSPPFRKGRFSTSAGPSSAAAGKFHLDCTNRPILWGRFESLWGMCYSWGTSI